MSVLLKKMGYNTRIFLPFVVILVNLHLATSVFAQVPPTPAAERLKVTEQRKALESKSVLNEIKFRNIGPTIMSGRVVDIDANPEDPTEFYVAYATWRDRSAFTIDGNPSTNTATGLVVKAFLLNILNPKLTIFFLAFLPQFIQLGTTKPLFQLLLLSATFMVMTFVIFVAYGFLAHAFRKAVIESPRVQTWFRRGFAAAFACLGAELALTEK